MSGLARAARSPSSPPGCPEASVMFPCRGKSAREVSRQHTATSTFSRGSPNPQSVFHSGADSGPRRSRGTPQYCRSVGAGKSGGESRREYGAEAEVLSGSGARGRIQFVKGGTEWESGLEAAREVAGKRREQQKRSRGRRSWGMEGPNVINHSGRFSG